MADTQSIIKLSLADYKKQIKELKEELFSLQKGSDEYNKTLQQLRDTQSSYNSILKDIKAPAQAAEGSYNALVQQMAKLRETWKSTSDVVQRTEIGKQMNDINNQLKELDLSIGNHQRNVGDYEIATKSLKAQIKENTAELAKMQIAGQAGTAAFEELAKRTGDMSDALGDAKAAIKDYANDVQTLSYGVDIIKSTAAAYGALTSAMTLFGVENKSAQETVAKMTTLLTLLNSLESIQTMLMDKASLTYRAATKIGRAFGIIKDKEVVSTAAASTEINANTVATNANAVAQRGAAAATTATTASMQGLKVALIETGIGALVVGLGMLIAHFKQVYQWVDKTTKSFGKVGNIIASITVPVVGLIKVIGNLIYRKKDDEEQSEATRLANEKLSKSLETLKDNYDATGTKVLDLRSAYDAIGKAIQKATGDRKEEQRVLKVYNKQLGQSAGEYTSFAKLKIDWSSKVKDNLEKYLQIEVLNEKRSIALKKAAQYQYNIDVLNMQKKAHEDRVNAERAAQREALKQDLDRYKKYYEENKDNSVGDYFKSQMEATQKLIDSYSNITLKGSSEIDKSISIRTKNLNDAMDLVEQYSNAIAQIDTGTTTSTSRSSSSSKTSKTTSSKNEASQQEIKQLTKENNALTDDYNQKLQSVNHTWQMIDATGGEALQNQIDNLNEVHQITVQYYNDTIANIEKELKSEKLSADDREKLERELKDTKFKLQQENDDNEKKSSELRKKLEQEVTNDFIKQSERRINRNDYALQRQLVAINHQYDAQIALADDDEAKQQLQNAKTKALNDANITALQNEIEELQNQQAQVKANTDEWLKLADAIQQAQDKISDYQYDNSQIGKGDKKELRKSKATWQDWSHSVTSLIGNVIDAEKANLDARVKSGKTTEEEAEKQFENIKKQQIALAIVNTLSGAVAAYMADTHTYKPASVGIAMGIIDAATTLAAGYAQIQQIKSTTYGSTTTPGGSSFTGVATAPLLNENLDANTLQSITTQSALTNQNQDQRVYILQSDIVKSNRQVEVRQSNTTF